MTETYTILGRVQACFPGYLPYFEVPVSEEEREHLPQNGEVYYI